MAKTTKKADTEAAKKTEETKTVEVKAVETKTAPKTEEVKAEKKPAAKKAAAPKAEKKPAAKKAAAPKAEKKPAAAKKTTAAKAAGVKMMLEYKGVQVSTDDIVAAVKAAAGKAKALEIYVKPEDGAAYYVADGVEGKVSF